MEIKDRKLLCNLEAAEIQENLDKSDLNDKILGYYVGQNESKIDLNEVVKGLGGFDQTKQEQLQQINNIPLTEIKLYQIIQDFDTRFKEHKDTFLNLGSS